MHKWKKGCEKVIQSKLCKVKVKTLEQNDDFGEMPDSRFRWAFVLQYV